MNFGIFEPLFESAPHYLALLNLWDDVATRAVEEVRKCCRSVPDPHPDICRLLREPNWRPHLVGAVASLVSSHNPDTIKLLWRCVDTGSWVVPQIAATLFVIDPDFLEQARERLAARCPVETSELISMTLPERHSAAGPAGNIERSAKAAQTLMELVKMISPQPSWVHDFDNSAEIRALLARDIDPSGEIARHWLLGIKSIAGRNGGNA